MTEVDPRLPEQAERPRMQDLQLKLQRLERRDWWLWWTAVVVMLLLTLAVLSLALPALWREQNLLFQINLDLAVRGLTGLVLLFNTYVIYQQLVIKRLRQQLGEQIDYMVRLEVRAEQFEKLSVLDPLTGLYNRRSADMRLRAEVERSRRHAHPLTLVMFDLNDFKQTNDRYGHAAGDLVLKEFGDRLLKAVRVSDVAVRLGGDEFMVILPECQPDQVVHLLARLRPMEVMYRDARLPVHFSAGWAGYQAGESAETLQERTDQALYADKRARKQQAVATPA
jgi:diguanylate cyclase (GGDEF)-like protein